MKTHFRAIYRFLFAALGLLAIITEVVVLISRHTFTPSYFFSYFTIQSNVIGVVTLAIFGWFAYTKNGDREAEFNVLRGAATLYLTMTGIIFALLLAPIENTTLTAVPWDNIVLHYIMPIALMVDWLLNRTGAKISFRLSLYWLLYPVAYCVCSLIRGQITGWYPYPFLNAVKHGYVRTIITILILTIFIVLASQILRQVSGFSKRIKKKPCSVNAYWTSCHIYTIGSPQ